MAQLAFLESLMGMEVFKNYLDWWIFNPIFIGREVALYVKDRYVNELKGLQSFKNKDYAQALKESFIRIDEMLKSQ